MTIAYSSNFQRAYSKLPFSAREKAKKAEKIFQKDPFDTRLKAHKLHGKLTGSWAFWIDWRYRVIFEFGKEDTVYFHTIGGHTIYR